MMGLGTSVPSRDSSGLEDLCSNVAAAPRPPPLIFKTAQLSFERHLPIDWLVGYLSDAMPIFRAALQIFQRGLLAEREARRRIRR